MNALVFEDGTVLPIYNSLDEAFPYLPHSTPTTETEPHETIQEEIQQQPATGQSLCDPQP